MSLFGAFGDLDEDPIFGQMNSVMNSFFGGDPFGGLLGGMGGMQPFGRIPHNALMAPYQNPMMARHHHNAMMPFGFPPMGRPGPGGGFMQSMMAVPGASSSFTSTSYVSMSSGPDGQPQIYQASSSTKTGPNGVMETKKTVQDSRTGVKKMAIGHHIYDRGHIIEREQNLHEGTEEERQDFINLEEEDAEDFNREFLAKAGKTGRPSGPTIQCIETGPLGGRNQLPAIMPPSHSQPSSSRIPVEVVDESEEGEEDVTTSKTKLQESASEPIIELPESPSPPPQTNEEHVSDTEQEEPQNNGRRSNAVPSVSRSTNPLGVLPRNPIRTHQASPLATMRAPGSSMRSGAAHPYNAQPSRKPHRPMKGTMQHHHNSWPQNPQYERDNDN